MLDDIIEDIKKRMPLNEQQEAYLRSQIAYYAITAQMDSDILKEAEEAVKDLVD